MNGSGGSFKGEGNDDGDDDDKSPFTKEERKMIKQAIITAYEDSRNQDERKIEILTERGRKGDIDAVKILAEKKTLQEIVKPKHPRNIQEHIEIVNGDMQKLFAINKGTGNNGVANMIPKEFRLSQNYPNPFNPVTKIKYELPRDVKVNLVIYDILGREVLKLVNSEFKKAGRYVVEFNGLNFASGVYFYRIEAGEFVESKKMVILK